jgi:hypothetical protein
LLVAAAIGSALVVTACEGQPETPAGASAQQWRLDMAAYMLGIADSLDDLAVATADPVAVLTDEPTRVVVASALARLQECASDLNLDVGPPPTQELRAVENRVRRACEEFERAADDFATGADNGDPVLLNRAADELDRGTALFHEAQDMLAGGEVAPERSETETAFAQECGNDPSLAAAEVVAEGLTCSEARRLIDGYLDESEIYVRGDYTCARIEEGDFIFWRCENALGSAVTWSFLSGD